MQPTEKLQELLNNRFAKNRGWFAKNYEEALARIKDSTDEKQNPHFYAPNFEGSAFMTEEGPLVNDEISEWSPADVRIAAFEMLVLADLAEVAPLPED